MLELLSEPLYILAAVQLRFQLRAAVDTVAIIAKSAATVALLRSGALPPALALSWAQIAFAGVTVACYAAAYARDVPSWLRPEAAHSRASEIVGQAAGSGAASDQQAEVCTSQADSGGTGDAAAAAAGGSTLRQRRPQQALGGGGEAEAQQPGAPREQRPLLHGPILWLCGSFSLQASSHTRCLHPLLRLSSCPAVQQ